MRSEVFAHAIRRIPNHHIKTDIVLSPKGVVSRTSYFTNYFFELLIFG